VIPKLVLGLALLLAGAGAWMLATPKDPTPPRRLSQNQPVNPGALDLGDISANNSPTAARNPNDPANVVVANRVDRPNYSCSLHASFDGARTWQQVKVPFPAGEEEPARCYAPDVAFATDGTLHLSFVTLRGVGNTPSALWSLSSRDGGRTMSTPVRVTGPLAFQVQLTADPQDAGRLHLTWLQASEVGNLLFPTANNPIVTSTSIDGGATWSGPTRVSPETRARVVAPAPAVGPAGELYVAYLDLLDDRLDYGGAHEGRGGEPHPGPWALVLARSVDQGATWLETVVDGDLVPTERFVVFLPPTPSLAVDPASGRLHIAFTDGRLGDADVELWTSSDGGKSFGNPVRVNDTPEGDGRAQYLPRVDVAPGGRLDVVYFDRRNDPENARNEVSLQSSFDHGRTFTTQIVLTDQPFSSMVGPGGERQLPDLGNRMALVSTERLALAVWTDTRAGTLLTQKQDLASAVIEAPRPASTPYGWLRYVGAALVALGLASIVFGMLSRRSAAKAAAPAGTQLDGPGSPGAAVVVDPAPQDGQREELPAPVATEPSSEQGRSTLIGAGHPAEAHPDRSDASFAAGRPGQSDRDRSGDLTVADRPGADPDRGDDLFVAGRSGQSDRDRSDDVSVADRPSADPDRGDDLFVAGRSGQSDRDRGDDVSVADRPGADPDRGDSQADRDRGGDVSVADRPGADPDRGDSQADRDRGGDLSVADRPGADPDRGDSPIDSGGPLAGDPGPTVSQGVDGRPAVDPDLGNAPVVAGRPVGADPEVSDAPAEAQAIGDASLAAQPLPPAAPEASPVTVHEPTSWASEAALRTAAGPSTAVPPQEVPDEVGTGSSPQPVPWAALPPADHELDAKADPASDADPEAPIEPEEASPEGSEPTPPALQGIWNRRPGGPDGP